MNGPGFEMMGARDEFKTRSNAPRSAMASHNSSPLARLSASGVTAIRPTTKGV